VPSTPSVRSSHCPVPVRRMGWPAAGTTGQPYREAPDSPLLACPSLPRSRVVGKPTGGLRPLPPARWIPHRALYQEDTMSLLTSPRRIRHSLRRPSAALSLFFVAAIVAGGVATRSIVVPAPVYAACLNPNQACFNDVTKTAVVDVYYYVPAGGSSIVPVEPDSATTYTISGVWSPTPPLTCNDTTENATVDITWSATGWVVSNFVGTANILTVSVCSLSPCEAEDMHAYAYRMYVNLNDPSAMAGKNLSRVTFTATTVPDGHELDPSPCELGSATTPTASSFNSTDSGIFECPYNCSATGATLNITYN